MWYSNEAKHYGHYFARTRIAVEQRSFVWNIEQFRSFQESICEIASSSAEQSMITLKYFPSCGQNSEIFIRVEVCPHDPQLKNSTFLLYLMDTSGNRTKCLNDEIAFGTDIKTTPFSLTFSKEELMKNESRYLPNDVLQLYCECDIGTGIVLEETEKISFGCPLSIREGNLTCNDMKSEKMFLEAAKILIGNLESSYKENSLCDTKLKTKTCSFLAHKFILGAHSPVFKAMFTNDMRGRGTANV
ncbi:tdpoz1 [Trichonephila clavata]|uniref:Tdpoz1 n=1 Tax=Trichonephila clavata TaxID=2740835 RepID=A0A8X6HXA6_TRICU|nr:tdpoz1 [Trichonephila clavata]